MNQETLRILLDEVARGATSVDSALAEMQRMPFDLEHLPFATIDHHRALRCGHQEVIFAQGKTVEQVVAIAERLGKQGGPVLVTRVSDEQSAGLRERFGNSVSSAVLGRVALVNAPVEAPAATRPVAVICAGTADLPVVEEASFTLRAMNVPHVRLTDVGVSGLHRLLTELPAIQNACAIVVVAGMEGALPSVVGGLVSCPVFAVPTSVGYGLSFSGLAALLGMMNSCASCVSVVNIDNGFGAAYCAGLVYKQVMVGTDAARR